LLACSIVRSTRRSSAHGGRGISECSTPTRRKRRETSDGRHESTSRRVCGWPSIGTAILVSRV